MNVWLLIFHKEVVFETNNIFTVGSQIADSAVWDFNGSTRIFESGSAYFFFVVFSEKLFPYDFLNITYLR